MLSIRTTVVPFDEYLGAALIGVILASIIYGITCLQVYTYFTKRCKHDKFWIKLLVSFAFLGDTFHVALLAHFVYIYTIQVTKLGDSIALSQTIWSLLAQVIVGTVTSGLIQLFFAYRIFCLNSRHLLVPGVITILVVAEIAISIGYASSSLKIQTSESSSKLLKLIAPWPLSGQIIYVVCDVIITLQIVSLLRRNKCEGERLKANTNMVINRLVGYMFSTGLLVTAAALTSLTLFLYNENALLYTPAYFIQIRLYLCSNMSFLNSRKNLRKNLFRLETEGPKEMTLASMQFHRPSGQGVAYTESTSENRTEVADVARYNSQPSAELECIPEKQVTIV